MEHSEIITKSNQELDTAFHILNELMNADCFDFTDVENLDYNKRKEYLRDKIFEYFQGGETNLGGIIDRVDSENYLFEGITSLETIENINDFFHNELLVADVILFMDKYMYDAFANEN